mmetsp:Transcript_10620/g.17578  ORF Transcript_10620/g.17578 Transcript_10620/m.17578 type:complete len:330 (+) Transcript_10620:144-1133(+)
MSSKDRSMSSAVAKEHLTAAAKMVQGLAKPLAGVISFLLPTIIFVCSKAWAFYKSLPKNAVKFWTGFVFCFFGGLYPVTFAAVQAAEHGGRKKVVESLTALSEEALIILDESKKDDKKDDDGDGVEDVKQIDSAKFAMRKVNLVMTKMNPKKVDTAIATLYRVWLSVIAVLMVQFARTISLALSISDFIMKPVDRFITPTLLLATPKEYERWVPVVLGWAVKSIAMSIAWTIQTVISAVASAMTGGRMMGEAFYDFCAHRNWTLGGLIPANNADSYVDEAFMYLFAALGIYFQFKIQFDIPSPFNLLLWPLEVFEYYLKWTITKSGTTA